MEQILDMYDDPDAHFSDTTRVVSALYKQHSLAQLKKDFRFMSVNTINTVARRNNSLFVPCSRALKNMANTRKSRRSDHELSKPPNTDLDFLQVRFMTCWKNKSIMI